MRPCLNLISLTRTDFETAVCAAAGAGFGAVELWADSLERYLETHTVEDVRGLLESHRVEAVSIGDIESITFCTPNWFEALRRRCEHLAAVARAISCPTLVVSASVRPRGADEKHIAEEAASALDRLLDVVEPEGVGLALAFRGFLWCAVNTLDQAREAVAAHSKRRAGLVLDTFDLHAAGEEPNALMSIDPAKIFVVRMGDCEDFPPALISDTCRALPGEGAAKLDEMLQVIGDLGWTGPVSLKVTSPKLINLDAGQAAQVVMAVSAPYLEAVSGDEDR